MEYKKLNTYLGWLVFIIATTVYFITIEDTVSLWDCGEYITAAYKLEVGHPPGAPFFMVLGRLFSFFADPINVAVWINRLSALSSSFTILFMFWSLTILVKKMILKSRTELSSADKVAVFASAAIGSLAYTFTESFWFSAVEGEVYAMASLFTAIVFWAILKWDEEMGEIKYGLRDAYGTSPDRWLVFIMFMLGLAIGVHLLGILVVPAITFIIYFRYSEKVNFVGIFLVGILSIFILGFIQEAVIPGSISLASKFEVFFVNSLGMPFFSGSVFFFLLLIAAMVIGLRYARSKGNRIMYSAFMGLIMLLIGYGSFAVIVIRSNANTPLDENNPENLVTLTSYLKREQYGSNPILFGPAGWNAEYSTDEDDWGDQSPMHLRRFVVQNGEDELGAFEDQDRANKFASKHAGSEVVEKYFEVNKESRKNRIPAYEQTTFFSRMYWNSDLKMNKDNNGNDVYDWGQKTNMYMQWSGYDPDVDKGTELGRDGKRLPTLGENVTYFWNYQVNFMYMRYFLWNFAGRQNDIQGHGSANQGNWASGYAFIDESRIGATGDNAPYYTSGNPSNNYFYFLPLIFGLIGMIFHFYRAPKDAFVVLLAFLFTGLAIVVYLNQKPFEPRERDYAYAGSFYFFAMWIGIGVYALYESFRSFANADLKKMAAVIGAGTVLALMFDIGMSDVSKPITYSWLVMSVIGGGLMFLMNFLGKSMKDMQGAVLSGVLALCVPLILAVQGWDDHDRSMKTTAHDLAANYLNSCSKNGILFTNGDNDTFPLWYMQEVEGFRTDVRVCNLSLMQTDWYTNQMKMKAYDSDPLPIKFQEEQILMEYGNTDMVYFTNLLNLYLQGGTNDKMLEQVIDMRLKANTDILKENMARFNMDMTRLLNSVSGTDNRTAKQLNAVKGTFAIENVTVDKESMKRRYESIAFIYSALSGKKLTMEQEAMKYFGDLVQMFDDAWAGAYIQDIMAFVRNDDNLLVDGKSATRVFPTDRFIIPVNVENAVKSGVITADQKGQCKKELNFKISGRAITREQVMMLDIIANNDWKRGIFFSSPYGSTVSSSLYRQGCIRQNGLAFELSPLDVDPIEEKFGGQTINAEKMYKNLMEVYSYGQMNNPDVLTDYYARRHTSQYRQHFFVLANYYLSKSQADPATAVESKQRALNLIKKSLQVMPADVVIDYGEPSALNSTYKVGDREVQKYQDGILHEYVKLLVALGEDKMAMDLAKVVAGQLESIFTYFEKSDARLVWDAQSANGFFAALDAYFILHEAVYTSNPDSKLTAQMDKKLDHLYRIMRAKVKTDLDNATTENPKYEMHRDRTDLYFELMGIRNGMLENPGAKAKQVVPQGDIDELLQQANP